MTRLALGIVGYWLTLRTPLYNEGCSLIMFCTRLKNSKCKFHGSLDFYYRKLRSKCSEQLYSVNGTFQKDHRTCSVLSDCCKGLFFVLNGTLSSSEIVCRRPIYKRDKEKLVRLNWTWGGPLTHRLAPCRTPSGATVRRPGLRRSAVGWPLGSRDSCSSFFWGGVVRVFPLWFEHYVDDVF